MQSKTLINLHLIQIFLFENKSLDVRLQKRTSFSHFSNNQKTSSNNLEHGHQRTITR